VLVVTHHIRSVVGDAGGDAEEITAVEVAERYEHRRNLRVERNYCRSEYEQPDHGTYFRCQGHLSPKPLLAPPWIHVRLSVSMSLGFDERTARYGFSVAPDLHAAVGWRAAAVQR